MVPLMVILFSTKCFLLVYMYIDLFKFKAFKPFENSDADLSWLLKKEANLFFIYICNKYCITYSNKILFCSVHIDLTGPCPMEVCHLVSLMYDKISDNVKFDRMAN